MKFKIVDNVDKENIFDDYSIKTGSDKVNKNIDSLLLNNKEIISYNKYYALKLKIKKLLKNILDYEDKLLSAHSELENTRLRSQKEIENVRKFSLDRITISLLPVLDSLEKAIEISMAFRESIAIYEGVNLTIKMFLNTLFKHGVDKISSYDKIFNPNYHDAIATEKNILKKNNLIVGVFQNGYTLIKQSIVSQFHYLS